MAIKTKEQVIELSNRILDILRVQLQFNGPGYTMFTREHFSHYGFIAICILYDVLGLRLAYVAEICGRQIPTVRRLVCRAREQMQRCQEFNRINRIVMSERIEMEMMARYGVSVRSIVSDKEMLLALRQFSIEDSIKILSFVWRAFDISERRRDDEWWERHAGDPVAEALRNSIFYWR